MEDFEKKDESMETSFKQFKISENAPTVLIVMGMAGSGKTTFVHVSMIFHKKNGLAFDRTFEGAR
jgi:ABC-type lipoprotein export system ATPase subunit